METIEFKNVAGIALINARANDTEGWFVFDTGAMQTVLNKNYFPKLEGDKRQIAIYDSGMTGTGAMEARLDKLVIEKRTVRAIPVILTDMSYVEAGLRAVEPEVRVYGSIGLDAFGRLPILMDYGRSRLTVEPDISADGAEKIPLSLEALPVINVTVSGEEHRFVLDTGANTCLVAGELSEKIDSSPMPDAPGVSVIPKMTVGTHEYSDVATVFTDISHIRSRVEADGVIGYQILSPQLSLLDLPNSALYLF